MGERWDRAIRRDEEEMREAYRSQLLKWQILFRQRKLH